jgi:hypothetical protein
MSGQPKASFWVAVWLVVFALAGFAAWQWGLFGKPGQPGGDGNGGAAPGVAADGGQEGPAAGLEGLS